MRILGLFDKYFLILVAIIAFNAAFIDFSTYKKSGLKKESILSRKVGIYLIVIAVILYLAGNII